MGRLFPRARHVVAAAALVVVGLASVDALGATPNLTGSWNPASGPPSWNLKASSDLRTLTATWSGGAGHPDLHGSFSGSLSSDGNSYVGHDHITEDAVDVHGDMTFHIDSPSRLTVTYSGDNGTSGTVTLTRGAQKKAIHWSYSGYANDVKVVPPLVGAFQLGVSRSSGSGTGAQGTVTTTFTPKYQARYGGPYSFTASVNSYSYHASAHGKTKKLALGVTITQTNGPMCAVGDTGTLSLTDSSKKLSNHQRADKAEFAWDNSRCPGFVQGWSNADGGAKTSPRHGGPPHGGNWAIVSIG